jgi:hypothetical protein
MSKRYPNNLELTVDTLFAVIGSIVDGSFMVLTASGQLNEYSGDEDDRAYLIEGLKSDGYAIHEMDGQQLALVTDMMLGDWYGNTPPDEITQRDAERGLIDSDGNLAPRPGASTT